MDAYYYLASQGDKEAYKILLKEFTKKAEYTITNVLNQYKNYPGNLEDFREYIGLIFLKTTSEYNSDKGSFTWFVKYVLCFKFERKISGQLLSGCKFSYSLNESIDESRTYLDMIEDPRNESMFGKIAIENFTYTIASPNRKLKKADRLRNKVILLSMAGYNKTEISKKLNISMGKVREIIRKFDEDDELVNLKLELK